MANNSEWYVAGVLLLGAGIGLVFVGILIGVWINAGGVPTMIFYGLKVLKQALYFNAYVLFCSITSLDNGTSRGQMGS